MKCDYCRESRKLWVQGDRTFCEWHWDKALESGELDYDEARFLPMDDAKAVIDWGPLQLLV